MQAGMGKDVRVTGKWYEDVNKQYGFFLPFGGGITHLCGS